MNRVREVSPLEPQECLFFKKTVEIMYLNHNIYYTYKFIQTLQWIPIFAADYMIDMKKVDLIYSGSNFRDENTWDEKRLASSYSGVQMIAKAYHLEREYKDAPKFGTTLYCSALEPKICIRLYCRPFNVGTFRFCWCTLRYSAINKLTFCLLQVFPSLPFNHILSARRQRTNGF